MMKSGFWRLVALLLLVISSVLACETADRPPLALSIEELITIGPEEGDEVFRSPLISLSSASDRFFAFDWNDEVRLREFSRTGDFRGFLGRAGQGPGEFRTPAFVIDLPGTGVAVVDRENARITIYDVPMSRVLRTASIPAFATISSVLPYQGHLLIAGVSGGTGSTGLPIHLMNTDGRIIRSLGAQEAIQGSWNSGALSRSVAVAEDGSIWSAHRDTYVLERWDSAGNLLQSIRPEHEWFPVVQNPVIGSTDPARKPTPRVAGITVKDGFLWVIINIPRDDWTAELEPVPGIQPARYRFRNTLDHLFTARVHVIDPRSQELVDSGEIPLGITGVTADGDPYSTTFLGDVPALRVWAFTRSEGK